MVTDDEVRRVAELGEVDRSSAIPLYHQLEYLLRHDIETGRYRPGDALPSEGEICARYDVSRSVVRQTLTNLTHAGLIRTERGRGSFVAERKLHERFVQTATGLYDDLHRMGYDIRTHVVRQDVAELPLAVQEFLQTEDGIQIDRLRSVDGRVLTFIRSYLPASRCPGLEREELEDRSLYRVLADQYGLRVASGRRTVEAVAADNEVARHLGVREGEPVLLLRSSSRDDRGEPMEWFEAWHRGDRTMFEIEIVAGEMDQPFSSVVRAAPEDTRGGPDRRADERQAGPSSPGAGSPGTPDGAASLNGVGRGGSESSHPGRSRHADPDAVAGLVAELRRSQVVAALRAPRYGGSTTDVARVLSAQGFRAVEVTLGGDGALDALADLRSVDGILAGAGTVTTADAARDAIAAGARFLVAPVGADDVLAAAGETPVIVTGFTLNEVWAAWQATRAPVKVLPAAVGGPGYVSTLHGQLPDIPLVPAGGIAIDDAGGYLRGGATAVAIGESLCPSQALATGDTGPIAKRAEQLRHTLDTLTA